VQWRQGVDAHGVLAGHWELGIAVVEQPPAQLARIDLEV
jgi:hypothetical protein